MPSLNGPTLQNLPVQPCCQVGAGKLLSSIVTRKLNYTHAQMAGAHLVLGKICNFRVYRYGYRYIFRRTYSVIPFYIYIQILIAHKQIYVLSDCELQQLHCYYRYIFASRSFSVINFVDLVHPLRIVSAGSITKHRSVNIC